MLANGDKLIVTKKVAGFLNEGDIVKVMNVDEDGIISFAFGTDFMHMGIMNEAECNEHFKKVEEKQKAPTVTSERIDWIMENSEINMTTVFDKCTIVYCKLHNGFVIVETSACVSPENYDEKIGVDICLEKIKDKIWELEGYRLQEELYRSNMNSDCCDECSCEDEDEYDEYGELDCESCDDYDCPSNPNR